MDTSPEGEGEAQSITERTVFLAKTRGNSKMMLLPVITTNNFDNPVNISKRFLLLEKLPGNELRSSSHTLPKLEVPDSIRKTVTGSGITLT